MAQNVTTGPRGVAAGRGLWVAAGVSVALLIVGVVSLTITGYRADESALPLSAAEVNTPWVVFFAGLVGVAVCAVLLAAQRRGRAVGRTALWVVGALTVLVLVSGVVWAAAG